MLDITWTTVLDRSLSPIARPTHDGSMPPHIHPSSFRLSSLQTFVTIFQLFVIDPKLFRSFKKKQGEMSRSDVATLTLTPV
jgi:hypothetical protein